MKKTLLLLPIIGLVLVLTSCSLRRNFLMKDDSSVANDKFSELIDAIQTQDINTLKSLFSKNALKEAENLDESIRHLFDYFQGELISYNDWGGPGVKAEMEYGDYQEVYDATYDFETAQDKYRLWMEIITVDTTDADNVGIRSLYIIRFEEDTRTDFAYRGDRKHTPGINIGKVQENAEF